MTDKIITILRANLVEILNGCYMQELAKDPRIAAIRISNETGGAELSVTFKDGVPNYQVKAHGDTLEMHLAKPGHAGAEKAPEAHAKPHHGKKHH